MKRAKRKALLALLRRRTFVHEQLTPELAEKLGALEWFDQWDAHVRQRFGSFESSKELTTEELLKALKAKPNDDLYLYFWPTNSEHCELLPIPSDLTVTFAQPEQAPEEVRKAARKWLAENFPGVWSARDADGKRYPLGLGSPDHRLSLLTQDVRVKSVLAQRFNYNGEQADESVLDWKHPLMDQTLRLSAPKYLDEMISTAEYAARRAFSLRGGVPKPEVEPETMADFVVRVKETLKRINPSAHQPQPAVDATALSGFFDKDHMALVQEAVKEFGLAKALEYRSMPAKPEGYAVYNALSAINELEKDDEK